MGEQPSFARATFVHLRTDGTTFETRIWNAPAAIWREVRGEPDHRPDFVRGLHAA